MGDYSDVSYAGILAKFISLNVYSLVLIVQWNNVCDIIA